MLIVLLCEARQPSSTAGIAADAPTQLLAAGVAKELASRLSAVRQMRAVRAIVLAIHALQKTCPTDARLLSAGCGEAIIGAMRRFLADEAMVLTSLDALAALSLPKATGASDRLLRAGVVELLSVPISREHALRCDLSRCTLIRNLAAEPACRAALMRQSAPALILSSMRRSSASDEIAAAGCGAVRNLAMTPENRLPLLAAGCGDAIKRAAGKADGVSKNLAWAATSALFTLACEPANCVALSAEPSAATIVAALMAAHAADASIAWAATGLLLKSGSLPELRPSMLASGLQGALLDCISRHATDERVSKAAEAALGQLSAAATSELTS